MQSKQLLTASLLDILFEGRNKEYGAYSLRREYNKRLIKSLVGTGLGVALLLFFFHVLPDNNNNHVPSSPTPEIVTVILPAEQEPVVIKIKPQPPAAQLPSVASFKFTSPPAIVTTDNIDKNDIPPAVEDIVGRIDLINRDGDHQDWNGPSQETGKENGITADLNDYREKDDSIAIHVEIESSYPGGVKAWLRFLNKTFVYPQQAVDNRVEGVVLVKFIVDTSGKVSQVEAVSGPEELREEAVRVIVKSGRWNPAVKNGRQVKSFKKQSVIFQLLSE